MKRLVVVRAGSRTLHKTWLPAGTEVRGFDLLVCAYHQDAMGEDSPGLRHLWIPGAKIAGYDVLFKSSRDLIDQYDYIALIDDDIATSHHDIVTCFERGVEAGFSIWQPSLTWNSFYTFSGFLQVPGLSWRRASTLK